ncbi:conjugal transfer protein TraB [Streptomyces sp. NBC_00989]|uniref:conjugal transfer protein TraB n=1 Tax=Streptomyces sp. NBC_00989 TaxID=2903705 RepID=UPI00386DF137|nr:conjugal transfer protein TraB [Streptomyces sp. NBC_00989]
MSELVPRPANLPATTGKPSFTRLAARMVALTTAALALKEGLWSLKRRMESDAEKADRLADMCTEAEVEPQYTALITEAGTALRAVANASGELAAAADTVQTNSQGLHDAHQGEYRGVYEAVNASGVQQAKPGFYRTR